jgi:hypothetical protein
VATPSEARFVRVQKNSRTIISSTCSIVTAPLGACTFWLQAPVSSLKWTWCLGMPGVSSSSMSIPNLAEEARLLVSTKHDPDGFTYGGLPPCSALAKHRPLAHVCELPYTESNGRNSSTGLAYSTRPATPSREAALPLNEEYRRKDAHIASSARYATCSGPLRVMRCRLSSCIRVGSA